MHNTIWSNLLKTALVPAITLSTIQPAQADNTWISRPSLSAISLVAPAASRTGFNTSLSTQTTSFVLTYKGSASDVGKFAQINIFAISSGLSIVMTGSPRASSSGCEQQVLAGESHSCMFAIDGAGNAGITVTMSGVSLSSSFKYILLSGPNITQTDPAVVTFSAPKSKIAAVVPSVTAPLGGAALVRFRITENTRAVKDMKVTVTFKGSGEHASATTMTSDSSGQIYFYISNVNRKKPNTTVTATIQGTTIKSSATITWR